MALLAGVFLVALALVTSSFADLQINYDYDTYKFFDIKASLVLSCNDPSESDLKVKWLKDGKGLEDALTPGRYTEIPAENSLVIAKTVEGDAGDYSCIEVDDDDDDDDDDEPANVTVVAKPIARLPNEIEATEGYTLTIVCVVYGSPEPTVEWTIDGEVYTESRGRYKLSDGENGVDNAILTIENVTMEDRGDFFCTAKNVASEYMNITTATDSTFLRVRDDMAALWPFLGICAEVIIFLAILIWDARRRKMMEAQEEQTDPNGYENDQQYAQGYEKNRDARRRKQ